MCDMETKRKGQGSAQSRERMVRAMLEIMQEKPFASVTVSELASRAGVSRMTFYRNYDSMADVFRFHFDDMMEQFTASGRSISRLGTFRDKAALAEMFRFFQEESTFLKALFKAGFADMLLSVLDSYSESRWGDISTPYEISAFTGALFNLCVAWSENDFDITPEQMGEFLSELFAPFDGAAALKVAVEES